MNEEADDELSGCLAMFKRVYASGDDEVSREAALWCALGEAGETAAANNWRTLGVNFTSFDSESRFGQDESQAYSSNALAVAEVLRVFPSQLWLQVCHC